MRLELEMELLSSIVFKISLGEPLLLASGDEDKIVSGVLDPPADTTVLGNHAAVPRAPR